MAGILEIRRGSSGISLADGEFYLNKGINAVQIGSGSSVLTLVPLNRLISGDIILNGNIYANNITASSGLLSSSITSNTTVGGISSGQTFTSGSDLTAIFQKLLIKFEDSVISNLTPKLSTVPMSLSDLEVGANVTYNNVEFNSTAESPNGLYAINAVFQMTGSSVGDFTQNIGTLTSTNTFNIGTVKAISRTNTGSVNLIVTAKRSDNTQFITPISSSVFFRLRNHLFASATLITNNTTAQNVYNEVGALVSSQLQSGKSWTATCSSENANTNKFTYIVYPSAYSTLIQISKGASDVTTAFENLGTFDITNTFGTTINYRIYKSIQPGAFRNGDLIITN